MKKLLLSLIFLPFLFSCSEKEEMTPQQIAHEKNLQGFSVIVVDSCEYIIKREVMYYNSAHPSGFGYMAHKGNCRFCAERNKNK